MHRDGRAAAAGRRRASRRDAGVPLDAAPGRWARFSAGQAPALRVGVRVVRERNAGVLAGWPGGVPPPRSREARAPGGETGLGGTET